MWKKVFKKCDMTQLGPDCGSLLWVTQRATLLKSMQWPIIAGPVLSIKKNHRAPSIHDRTSSISRLPAFSSTLLLHCDVRCMALYHHRALPLSVFLPHPPSIDPCHFVPPLPPTETLPTCVFYPWGGGGGGQYALVVWGPNIPDGSSVCGGVYMSQDILWGAQNTKS